MKSHNILISACLVGQPVRYDGRPKTLVHDYLDRWQQQGRLIVFCPEVSAGLTIPRAPAEIANGRKGEHVLAGLAEVVDNQGHVISSAFIQGAYNTLRAALENQCRFALLTEASPSCGSQVIYDGTFSGQKVAGMGVTTALLTQHGIKVFSPKNIEQLYQIVG